MKKRNLKAGRFYIVEGRNFNLAVWTGEVFVGEYVGIECAEYHVDDVHGTCTPIREFDPEGYMK